jgi:hypothetical protein
MEQTILCGTTDGVHELGDDRSVRLAGHEVTSLARNNSCWEAITDGREVWRSGSDGEWTQVASVESLWANCLLPTASGVFVGTSEARLLALRGDALERVRSFDETHGRETWYTPWGGPPDVRSMSAAPSGAIYANVHVGGVVRSGDGGDSWEPTIDIHSDVHQVLFDPASGLVLAASARGLAVSGDEGRSWRFDGEGLHGRYLRAVAVADSRVLVSASTGPRTDRAALYHKPVDAQEPFQRCRNGLPEWFGDNIDTHCLAAAGSSVAFGTSEGSVFLSLDRGQSWTSAAEGLPPVRCVALA